jgi:hypothetical protein
MLAIFGLHSEIGAVMIWIITVIWRAWTEERMKQLGIGQS